MKPDYDTSLGRMAGNIAAGLVTLVRSGDLASKYNKTQIAAYAVELAREIVAEIKRTEPAR
jgi:hypothetical protein